MRVLIDTNVLISAALNPDGVAFQAYRKAASYPNHGLICEQNVDELKRVFNKKFPDKTIALYRFLAVALMTLELARTVRRAGRRGTNPRRRRPSHITRGD